MKYVLLLRSAREHLRSYVCTMFNIIGLTSIAIFYRKLFQREDGCKSFEEKLLIIGRSYTKWLNLFSK